MCIFGSGSSAPKVRRANPIVPPPAPPPPSPTAQTVDIGGVQRRNETKKKSSRQSLRIDPSKAAISQQGQSGLQLPGS